MFIENKYKKWYDQIIKNSKHRRLSNQYIERHHIIPKSLGGNDTLDNIAILTAREHFVVHVLLTKMTTGIAKRNMIFALRQLIASNQYHDRYINARLYETSRLEHAKYMSQLHSNKEVSLETRKKISESRKGKPSPFKGKNHSDSSKKLMSKSHKGHQHNTPATVAKIIESRSWYSHSKETKQKISDGNKGKSRPHSEETKKKISKSLKGRVPTWLKDKPAHNKGIPHSEETKQKLKLSAQNREKFKCIHCGKEVTKPNLSRWHNENCKFNS